MTRPPLPLKYAIKLLAIWEAGVFRTRAASVRYHFFRHGRGASLWTYLARAANFNPRRARRKSAPLGATRYEKGNGEFRIMRKGKIVSYGVNY